MNAPLDQQVLELIGPQMSAAAIGVARIGACFAWLPYLSSGTIASKLTRALVSFVVLLGIWPVTAPLQAPPDMLGVLWMAGQEVVIGTLIGLTVSLPFHAFHALGAIVDTQRGASMGSMLDPSSGIEATETANLLQMFSVVVFLASGGLLLVMEVLLSSYQLVPMGYVPELRLSEVHTFMATLLGAGVRMASPVLVLLLAVEIFLGVLSRFAQQLNAFSLALAVKSFIALLALLLYLAPMMVDQLTALWEPQPSLDMLMRSERTL